MAENPPRHIDNAEGSRQLLVYRYLFFHYIRAWQNHFAMLRARPRPVDFIGGHLLEIKILNRGGTYPRIIIQSAPETFSF